MNESSDRQHIHCKVEIGDQQTSKPTCLKETMEERDAYATVMMVECAFACCSASKLVIMNRKLASDIVFLSDSWLWST